MITDKNRAGWFGASDTHIIMGNWETATFAKWWAEKLGMIENNISTPEMQAGTAYEHAILDFVGATVKDRQIKIPKLKLRVNLDGEDEEIIDEAKTYGYEGGYIVIPANWEQCQVQIFAAKKPCRIIAYRLLEEDYKNYFNPIDPERISKHPIDYDRKYIGIYLEVLEYLKECLVKGVFPDVRNKVHRREDGRRRALDKTRKYSSRGAVRIRKKR